MVPGWCLISYHCDLWQAAPQHQAPQQQQQQPAAALAGFGPLDFVVPPPQAGQGFIDVRQPVNCLRVPAQSASKALGPKSRHAQNQGMQSKLRNIIVLTWIACLHRTI